MLLLFPNILQLQALPLGKILCCPRTFGAKEPPQCNTRTLYPTPCHCLDWGSQYGPRWGKYIFFSLTSCFLGTAGLRKWRWLGDYIARGSHMIPTSFTPLSSSPITECHIGTLVGWPQILVHYSVYELTFPSRWSLNSWQPPPTPAFFSFPPTKWKFSIKIKISKSSSHTALM